MEPQHDEVVEKLDLDLDLAPPILLDHDFVKLVAERSRLEAAMQRKMALVALFVGMLLGVFCAFSNIPFWQVLSVSCGAAWLIGTYLSVQLGKWLSLGRYDLIEKSLSKAIVFNSQWSPITYFQLCTCLQTYFGALLTQSRNAEFEAVTRYSWAYVEKKSNLTGTPRNWMIANNLAVAFLVQGRHEQAAEILQDLLEKHKKGPAQLFLLTNLSVSLIRDKKVERAEATVQQARKIFRGKTESAIGWRLLFVEGLIAIEKGHLDEAEKIIEQVKAAVVKIKEPAETQADLYCQLGRIRMKQERFAEAEMHVKTAIDIIQTVQNPSHYALALYHKELATIYAAQGEVKEAREAIERAAMFRSMHIEKEASAISQIRARLQDRNRIWSVAQLTAVTPARRLIK